MRELSKKKSAGRLAETENDSCCVAEGYGLKQSLFLFLFLFLLLLLLPAPVAVVHDSSCGGGVEMQKCVSFRIESFLWFKKSSQA